MRRYRFLDPGNPHCVEAIVYKKAGINAKLPAFWENKEVYIYYPDGMIEKRKVTYNTSIWVSVPIREEYEGQMVQIRLKEKIVCPNLQKYL
jgi:hypothetical protein